MHRYTEDHGNVILTHQDLQCPCYNVVHQYVMTTVSVISL